MAKHSVPTMPTTATSLPGIRTCRQHMRLKVPYNAVTCQLPQVGDATTQQVHMPGTVTSCHVAACQTTQASISIACICACSTSQRRLCSRVMFRTSARVALWISVRVMVQYRVMAGVRVWRLRQLGVVEAEAHPEPGPDATLQHHPHAHRQRRVGVVQLHSQATSLSPCAQTATSGHSPSRVAVVPCLTSSGEGVAHGMASTTWLSLHND